MPSLFPGMDPYLEDSGVWPGFHIKLACEISTELNRTLPRPYYARLGMRPELGIVEEQGYRQRIVPGLAVVRHSRRSAGSATVVLDRPRKDVSPFVEVTVHVEPVRHHYVEIRDSARDHRLVTLIEILSPSNKRPGPDREAYRLKQWEVLQSAANLIELDLLRGGEAVLPDFDVTALVGRLDPRPDYLVLVNRAWRRLDGFAYQVFPASLREWLPCIPVPLRLDEAEVPLDLQFVFNRAYDGGPYRRGAIDYSRPPVPPLSGPDAEWAEALVRAQLGPAEAP